MDPGKAGLACLFRCFCVFYEYMIRDEMTQVNGFVFLIDFTGVPSKLVTKFITKDISEHMTKWLVGVCLLDSHVNQYHVCFLKLSARFSPFMYFHLMKHESHYIIRDNKMRT